MRVSGRGLSGVYKNLAGAMGGNKACCLCVRARGWEGFGEHACSHCKDRARTLSLARPFPEWSDTQYQEHQASAPELSVVSGVMASARMGEDGPTIVVKVLKADKVRTNARGDAPDPMVTLRIIVGRCPPFLPSEAARACCPDDALTNPAGASAGSRGIARARQQSPEACQGLICSVRRVAARRARILRSCLIESERGVAGWSALIALSAPVVLVASTARCQQCADGNGSGATCIAGGSGAGEYFNSKTLHGTTEPSWNEEFTLPVKDPANSQLECLIWDQSGAGDTPAQKFLGEVFLNLAKLVPYNKSTIEQVFDIRQGKTHKATADDKKATGNLKLGLQLIIPDDAGSGPPAEFSHLAISGAGQPLHPPPPPQAAAVTARLGVGESEPETPPPPIDATAAQLLDIISSSAVLSTMSNVRKLALQQALVHASCPDKAVQICLDSLVMAPCMPSGSRDNVSELLLTYSWNDLRHTLQCPPLRYDQAGRPLLNVPSCNSLTHFQHYRSMVVAIFTRSRKMASLPPERRRQLGAMLHHAQSISQISTMSQGSRSIGGFSGC